MSGGGRRALRAAALAALLAAAGLATACGYGIVGVGGQLPGGVTRVEVPIFENRTTRSDIGRKLTEDFVTQIQGSSKVSLATGEQAQALVRGTVTTYRKDPITFDAKQKPLENRLTIVMDIALTAREGGRVLFQERNVTVRYDYPVKSDLQENDRLEEEAMQSASEQMSQKLVTLMLEGF